MKNIILRITRTATIAAIAVGIYCLLRSASIAEMDGPLTQATKVLGKGVACLIIGAVTKTVEKW